MTAKRSGRATKASKKPSTRKAARTAKPAGPAAEVVVPPLGPGPKFVVGIGASAGGLHPIEQFFDHLPASLGSAFVVVQHLSPDFKSLMKELLSRHTKMQVYRVENGMALEPDCVYLIPPKKNLLVEEGRFRLTDQDLMPGHAVNYPIDVFFDSLARSYGDRAVGVILSGTGSDGSRGIRAINEHGGLVVIQAPDSAEFDGMPRSAAATGLVHYSLPAEAIPRTVHEYIKNRPIRQRDPVGEAPVTEQSELAAVLDVLHRHEGVDFANYKTSTVVRRVERRMVIAGCLSVQDYLGLLQRSEEERRALRADMLITVTRFFRDPDAWSVLEKRVLPEILKNAPANETIRVWEAGCATGEEVYTLAMLLAEAVEKAGGKARNVKIFATDIDHSAVERASSGIYPAAIVSDVPPDRLSRFFNRKGGYYHVNRQLREMVIFAKHDLTKDSPFTKMHMVVCRNVLIYMQPRLQAQVLSNLHFALKPGCCLFLGPSESLGDLEHEFAVEDRKWKMFRKLRDVLLPLTGRRMMLRDPDAPQRPAIGRASIVPNLPPEPLVNQGFDAFLRHRKGACLLIDEHARVRYMFGDVDRYIKLGTGRHSDEMGLLLVRELIVPVTTAMRRAKKIGRPVAYRSVTYRVDNKVRQAYVEVQYRAETRQWPEYYILNIEEVPVAGRARGSKFITRADSTSRALEQELLLTKENLQATIEELETANEEQQASNEELLASNEELQSTNEELHSVNEELYTINAEYQQKIQELMVITADMDHLLRSAEIGTVFLDERLCIRKFTTSSMAVFNLTDQDVGRPISHFTSNVAFPGLLDAIKKVFESGHSLEQEVQGEDGRTQLLRLHAYRAGTPEPRGVVLTIVDVSQLKQTERALQESEERYRLMERTVEDYAVIMLDPQGRIDTWNRGAVHLFGYTPQEAQGQSVAILGFNRGELDGELPHELHQARESGHARNEGPRHRRDGSSFWAEVMVYSLWSEDRQLRGFVAIVHDITERRRWAEALENANRELKKKNTEMEDFVYTVSHDLKSPLVTIGGMVSMLKEHVLKGAEIPVAEVFVKAEQTVRDMRETIDDLLELSRIGRMAGQRVPVDIANLVRELVDKRRPLIESANARVELSENLPIVHADPNRILQVMDNLLINAVKYGCDKPNAVIQIGGMTAPTGQRVYVRDQGCGIASEYHDRIFQLFERLDDSTEGSGVGLAIVRRVMEVHNGRAWVESAPDHGATFWIEFPATSGNDPDEDDSTDAAAPAPGDRLPASQAPPGADTGSDG